MLTYQFIQDKGFSPSYLVPLDYSSILAIWDYQFSEIPKQLFVRIYNDNVGVIEKWVNKKNDISSVGSKFVLNCYFIH